MLRQKGSFGSRRLGVTPAAQEAEPNKKELEEKGASTRAWGALARPWQGLARAGHGLASTYVRRVLATQRFLA